MDYFSEIVKSISNIVKIDSCQGKSKQNMPFGEGIKRCLDCYLNLANSLGFETNNYENFVGEVVWGQGEDFAVLVHLDVVPAGNGWTHKPFGGEIDEINKKIWGRGTIDDKGPAVISLYALKYLKDKGFKPSRKIKLIIGCNEETGWGCIEHYNNVCKMPEEGFSPDADFPVIYAEKGIMHIKFLIKNENYVEYISGGSASNMVCDRCEFVAPINEEKIKQYNLRFENNKIISIGKSAHGSTPQDGINAIKNALLYLDLEKIYKDMFVDFCGLKGLKDETGELTFSANVIKSDKDIIEIICDCRYPATTERDVIIQKLNESGYQCEIINEQKALYNDKNCRLIKTLCDVYNEIEGKKCSPIAIGGGTYARALKCGAGFGPCELNEESVMHKPDEYITFEKIEKCFKMYALALERLC